MHWKKLGLVFSPAQGAAWMRSHAQVPTPIVCDGFLRVYFSSRPERTLSLTSYVDLDVDDPTRIVKIGSDPILQPGPPGTFDEHGIMPSSAVRVGSKVYLYYSGWSRSSSVPYINSTGLAISEDGGKTFHKVSEGPILSRDRMNPYSATSPCVLHQGDRWSMWFCSGTGWTKVGSKFEHIYDIKHAISADGLTWTTSPMPAVKQRDPLEAITRPFVWQNGGGSVMMFCYRGSRDFRDGTEAYRMGAAISTDGVTWHRDDQFAGLLPSTEGWDARMVAYPAVVACGPKTYLFYNGNDFGAEGFGCALLSDSAK